MFSKYFRPETISRITKTFGPLEVLQQCKTLIPTIVYSPEKDNYENLFMIRMTNETPQFKEDWFHYHFLRAFFRCSILTGKCIRDEEKDRGGITYDFRNHTDLEEFWYYGTKLSRDLTRPQRPFLILTKNVDKNELMNFRFYKHKYAKLMITLTSQLRNELKRQDPVFMNFIEERGIEFLDLEFNDLVEAGNYLLEKRGMENVLLETGITIYADNLS